MAGDGPKVEYDVKELLDKLGDQILDSAKDVKLEVARLASLVETKASKESVDAVNARVTELDLRLSGRIDTLASKSDTSQGFSKGTWAVLALAVPAFVAIFVAILYLLSGVH